MNKKGLERKLKWPKFSQEKRKHSQAVFGTGYKVRCVSIEPVVDQSVSQLGTGIVLNIRWVQMQVVPSSVCFRRLLSVSSATPTCSNYSSCSRPSPRSNFLFKWHVTTLQPITKLAAQLRCCYSWPCFLSNVTAQCLGINHCGIGLTWHLCSFWIFSRGN